MNKKKRIVLKIYKIINQKIFQTQDEILDCGINQTLD